MHEYTCGNCDFFTEIRDTGEGACVFKTPAGIIVSPNQAGCGDFKFRPEGMLAENVNLQAQIANLKAQLAVAIDLIREVMPTDWHPSDFDQDSGGQPCFWCDGYGGTHDEGCKAQNLIEGQNVDRAMTERDRFKTALEEIKATHGCISESLERQKVTGYDRKLMKEPCPCAKCIATRALEVK